jgi:hypothetical protein
MTKVSKHSERLGAFERAHEVGIAASQYANRDSATGAGAFPHNK